MKTMDMKLNVLFLLIKADGWTDIQRRLAENYPGSQWFTIAFIFLGHFIFTNLFIGIIIMVSVTFAFKTPLVLTYTSRSPFYLHTKNFLLF